MSSSAKRRSLSTQDKEKVLDKVRKSLPKNWSAQFSKTHESRVFFYNVVTRERTWKHPEFNTGSCNEKKSSSSKPSRKRKSDETDVHVVSKQLEEEVPPDPESPTTIEKRNQTKSSRKRLSNDDARKPNLGIHHKMITTTHKRSKSMDPTINSGKSENVSVTGNLTEKLKTKACTSKSTSKKETPTDTNKKNDAKSLNSYPVETVHDIEMEDLSAELAISDEDSKSDVNISTKPKVKNTSMKSQSLFIILDTNVLLDCISLSNLGSFLSRRSFNCKGYSEVCVIVPWVVLQELDHLKKKKPAARRAISFLNEYFSKPHSGIRGQTIFEAAAVIDCLSVESNDDRVLQCCFFMQQSKENALPILLTRDKNLMNKALTNGFKGFENLLSMRKYLMQCCPETIPPASCHLPDSKKDAKKSLKIDSNNNHSPSAKYLENFDCKKSFEKSSTLLSSALGFILEKELKKAFDDLWLDVVLRKPPWSLMDILKCIEKHWLAVFKMMGVDSLMQVHVEKLIMLYNNSKDRCSSNETALIKWLRSSVNLILGIDQCGKYGNPVKDSLADLKEMMNSLVASKNVSKSTKKSLAGVEVSKVGKNQKIVKEPIESSSTCSTIQEENVEMFADEESTDFWIVLDKVWSAILLHCGMIFQSLQFVPSTIDDMPEVQQAMQTQYPSIPEKLIAARAVPLIGELVDSLKVILEKFLVSSENKDPAGEALFIDLLHTLWTTIQAFTINCSLQRLFESHAIICDSIAMSEEMMQRLKTGFEQLGVISNVIDECRNAVYTAMIQVH